MEAHRGRLIDHVHLRVKDLKAAKRFYKAGLEALGRSVVEGEGYFFCDELWVDEGGDDVRSHVHLAFQADNEDAVRRWHAAVLAAGGRDNGAPGERAYHPGYYAAFAFDPDGNNVEAVFHGPHRRSVESVVVSW